MYIGTIYNIIVCFIAGISGLIVFRKVRSLRRIKKRYYSKGLDFFLISFGILWILVGIRNLLFFLGYQELDKALWGWIVGPLTYAHILPLFLFYGWAFFEKNKKYHTLFIGLFSTITILAIASLFLYGFELAEITYWGTKYNANPITHKIFTYGMFLPALLCVILETARKLKIWKKTKDFYERQLFGYNLSFLIYAMVAVFDGLAMARGWTLLLVRVGIMISALMIYFFATEEETDREK